MSRAGEIRFAWGDGEYKFRLGIGQLRELQEACDAGPAFIASRLRGDTWLMQDVRETIRLGLIGGGMEPQAALAMVRKHVDEYPLAQNKLVAWVILQAAVVGVPEEVVGKLMGARRQATRSPQAKSPSPDSMAPGP